MKILDGAALKDELSSLSQRPGLLFGPGVTRSPRELAERFQEVLSRLAIPDLKADSSDEESLLAADAAFDARPEKQEIIRAALVESIQKIPPNLDIQHLIRAGWSAYISLTEDLLLEEALRNLADSIPSSKTVTIVDHQTVQPPARSYPVYKLLGSLNDLTEDRRVCVSESEYLTRKQSWGMIIRGLTAYLRDAPLYVVGFDASIQRLRDILGLISTQASPRVTKLRFLRGDNSLNDATLKALLKKFDVALVDVSIRELSEHVCQLKIHPSRALENAPEKSARRFIVDLSSHYDCPVSLVPPFSPTTIAISEIELRGCTDSLFRPASNDWRPFQANLDLRRDCTDDIVETIMAQAMQATAHKPRVLILVGEAGTGKTTIAKRSAIESSSNETLVIWARRISSNSWLKSFRKWLEDLSDGLKKNSANSPTRLILICDDPWGLRMDVSDALAALEKSPLPSVLVGVLRNSDRYVVELRSTAAISAAHKEIDISHILSENELKSLPKMLHGIGAVTSIERGEALVNSLPTKYARDILCSLWYLVPETKSQLAESLKDEYLRLGDSSAISDIAQSSAISSKTAHKAYEYVTVSSRLGIGLPIEILVQALGIDYDVWIQSLERGRPLWGLLYDEMSDGAETIHYFTRNDVVTRVLIDLVNGGLAGHMGEIRVLKELIEACNGEAPAYRNFLADLLIRARSKMEEIFTYEQGSELYELALNVLPCEDRLFEHHYGIWIQDKGPKDGTAYRQLEKALRTGMPLNSDRDAPREHIHASMAASLLQQIRSGAIDWKNGSEAVNEHLRLAANARFFNAHGAHVAANLLFETAQLAFQRQDKEAADRFTVAAFEEIEKAFQTVGAKAHASFQYNKTLGMLGDLQKKILSLIPDFEGLKAVALQLFEKSGKQSGFELAARRLLVQAITTGKGKDFNLVNDYLNECMTILEAADDYPTAELLAVRVDLMIRWRLHGFRENDWDIFRDDLLDILKEPKFADNALKRFYLGVAYFHLGQTSEANATFAQLRRENATNHRPNDIRTVFQDTSGHPRRFQGTARQVNNRGMVSIPELQVDAPLRSGGGPLGTIHVYVGFSFNGLIATSDVPAQSDLSLH